MSVVAPDRSSRQAFSGFGVSAESNQIEKLEQDIVFHYWAPVSRVSPVKRSQSSALLGEARRRYSLPPFKWRPIPHIRRSSEWARKHSLLF